jgi:prepilin-type N-terminal cleavage/methylation domain-containing protein
MSTNSFKQKKSFTLVELMIVIAILAILSAIVLFTLNPSRLFDNFRDTRRVNDIVTINKAIIFMES